MAELLCSRCKKRPQREPGRYCVHCYEYQRTQIRKRPKRLKDKERATRQKRYWDRKLSGKCTACGVELFEHELGQCARCRRESNRRSVEYLSKRYKRMRTMELSLKKARDCLRHALRGVDVDRQRVTRALDVIGEALKGLE